MPHTEVRLQHIVEGRPLRRETDGVRRSSKAESGCERPVRRKEAQVGQLSEATEPEPTTTCLQQVRGALPLIIVIIDVFRTARPIHHGRHGKPPRAMTGLFPRDPAPLRALSFARSCHVFRPAPTVPL